MRGGCRPGHRRGWHPRGRHHGPAHQPRLFWRVYRHGLFLLFAVGVAALGVGWAFQRGPSAWEEALELRQFLEAGGRSTLSDLPTLDRMLSRARERANADLSLYSATHQLLASNVEPPLPPVEDAASALARGPSDVGRRRWAIPVRDGGELVGYAVAQWRGPGTRQIARGAAIVFGVLAALALASAPLVRTIVAPVEKLTRAARRLGEGDLSTRSGIRRNDEVGELAEAFDEMAERLERLVRSERELLANVSHELRTPLSRTRVALELAAEGDAERARRYLREIGADLAELERLVDDVLTAAKLDAHPAGDGFPIRAAPVQPAELVGAAARRFREAWPDRPLVEEVAQGLPAIDADAALLRRVLDNLLDNARKYSEDGRPIALRAASDGESVRIEVADQGIGLDEEDLRRLFTPFFRSDRSRARGTGGVGLGLALARRIVEAHGGTLTAASAPGEGTTFTATLPLKPPALVRARTWTN